MKNRLKIQIFLQIMFSLVLLVSSDEEKYKLSIDISFVLIPCVVQKISRFNKGAAHHGSLSLNSTRLSGSGAGP